MTFGMLSKKTIPTAIIHCFMTKKNTLVTPKFLEKVLIKKPLQKEVNVSKNNYN